MILNCFYIRFGRNLFTSSTETNIFPLIERLDPLEILLQLHRIHPRIHTAIIREEDYPQRKVPRKYKSTTDFSSNECNSEKVKGCKYGVQ